MRRHRKFFAASFCLASLGILALVHSVSAEEKIAYVRLTNDHWQIWTMNPDGNASKQITNSSQDKRGPVWIHHGNGIAYRTNNGQLFIMDLADHQEQEILKQYNIINNPHCSNATDEIVFVRFDPRAVDISDIWKTDLKGNDPVLLTTGDKRLKYQPVFSSRGDKVAFVKAGEDNKNHHIWIMNADGTKPQPLTSGKGLDTLPSISPDGQWIAFSSNREDKDYEIYRINVMTKKIKRLTHQPGLDTSPVFSSDGQRIAFVSNRSGNQQIWVMNNDGSHSIQLTNDPEESIDPSWVDITEQKGKVQ